MPSRPHRKFNERKATQVAARFLQAAGGKMPYISLLKLMYFMDREALNRWGSPVTNDTYFSLDYGPILSNVKDLMVEEHAEPSIWATHISSPSNYVIELRNAAGNDQLSMAEERLIDEIHAKYRNLDRWEIVRRSHEELPEWTNPKGSRIKITIDDMLKAMGADQEKIDAIKEEIASAERMHALCSD